MGKIHSVFSGGTVDGPGIRFVVFTQGCPLRCKFCHNPDTWKIGAGEERSVDDLIKEIVRYKNYFGSEGGLTISGGEPLVQLDFITELSKAAVKNGVNVAVDTSGYLFDETSPEKIKKFDELNKYVDLYLLDIKHIDDDKHRMLTGVSNKHTLAFAKYLSESGKKMWIRHVLVPGITDDDDALIRLKEYIDTLKTVEKVEVLPYHTMGVPKYEKLGIDYPLKGVEPPSKERVMNAKRLLGITK